MTKVVLKKLKQIDKIWHPDSTLVFKSIDDKKVIGRFCDNEFISLDDVALDLCEKWNFTYDPDLVDEEEEVIEDIDQNNSVDEEVTVEKQNNSVEVVALEKQNNSVEEVTVEKQNNSVEEVTVEKQNNSVEEVVEEKQNNSGVEEPQGKLFVGQLQNDYIQTINEFSNLLVVKYNSLSEEKENYKNLYHEEVRKNEQLQKSFNELKSKFDNIKSMFS